MRLRCLSLLVAGVVALAGGADDSLEGRTPTEVLAILGAPAAKGVVGATERWEYDTPEGKARVHFISGISTTDATPAKHDHTFSADPDVLFLQAKRAESDHDRVMALRECVRLAPRHRACKALLAQLQPGYLGFLRERRTREDDLLVRRFLLEILMELEVSDGELLQREHDQLTEAIDTKNRKALDALLAIKTLLLKARAVADGGDVYGAFEMLRAYRGFKPIRGTFDHLSATAVRSFTASLEESTSFDRLDEAFVQVRYGIEMFSAEQYGRMRETVARQVVKLLGTKKYPTPAVARAIAEILPRKYPKLFGGPSEGLEVPSPVLYLEVVQSVEGQCPASLDLNALLPKGFARDLIPSGGLGLAVHITCSVEDVERDRRAVNSTYVASYQQHENPEYLDIAQRLAQKRKQQKQYYEDAARIESPAGRIAALVGAGFISADVNKVAAQLAATPRFLSQPVLFPYALTQFTVTRTARVATSINVTDPITAFHASRRVSAASGAKGIATENALPGDSLGYSNAPADLQPVSLLIDQAQQATVDELREEIEALIGEAMLARAATAKANSVERVGYALLARDASPSASVSGLDELMESLAQAPLEDLESRVVDTRSLVLPSRPVAAVAGNASEGTSKKKQTPIELALRSVVTITTPERFGSGFVVTAGGLCITNAHVVAGRRVVSVAVGSTQLEGKVLISDSVRDLALVEIAGFSGPSLTLGVSADVNVGQDVFAMGTPRGFENTVTKGIVSATRNIDDVQFIQTDAPISPGSSGGPLVDNTGRVVGINTWKRSDGDALGFAVGIDEARKLFGSFLK